MFESPVIDKQHVLFSCEDFVVVNKPAGLSVQCEPSQPGCVALLKSLLQADQLHPVHRLDKVTSGLLLVARTQSANRQLSLLFQLGKVEKYYYALSAKRPAKKQGSVMGDMCAARNGSWKLLRSQLNPAFTQFFCRGLQGLRLFTLKPYTGKTHQLRVALKSLGAPILGDSRYGGQAADRVYLHAAALNFCYGERRYTFYQAPDNGKHFDCSALRECLESMGHPSAQPWPVNKNKTVKN